VPDYFYFLKLNSAHNLQPPPATLYCGGRKMKITNPTTRAEIRVQIPFSSPRMIFDTKSHISNYLSHICRGNIHEARLSYQILRYLSTNEASASDFSQTLDGRPIKCCPQEKLGLESDAPENPALAPLLAEQIPDSVTIEHESLALP
jgi:hypothetical protein